MTNKSSSGRLSDRPLGGRRRNRHAAGQQAPGRDQRRHRAFLPDSAESTEVVRKLERRVPGRRDDQRPDRLPAHGRADRGRQARRSPPTRAARAGELPRAAAQPPVPFAPGRAAPAWSRRAATSPTPSLTVPTDFNKLADWGKEIREITGEGAGGLRDLRHRRPRASTPTPRRCSARSTPSCCCATVLLVLVLLGAIYRSLLVALIPLIVVVLRLHGRPGLHLPATPKSGATVSTNSTSILIVLMFGVGTDYCLLLVSRYREELRRIEDKHDAMARAMRAPGPAILASGLTVTLAMLVLLLADTGSTQLARAGGGDRRRLACWSPGSPCCRRCSRSSGGAASGPAQLVAYDPEQPSSRAPGLWRRFGDRVLQRPGSALVVTVRSSRVGALGLLAYKVDYSTTNFFKKPSRASRASTSSSRPSRPARSAPGTVLVERDGAAGARPARRRRRRAPRSRSATASPRDRRPGCDPGTADRERSTSSSTAIRSRRARSTSSRGSETRSTTCARGARRWSAAQARSSTTSTMRSSAT